MKINLHIDRLVLEGVPAGRIRQRHLKEAVASELSRLIADGGSEGAGRIHTGAQSRTERNVSAGTIALPARPEAGKTGHKIAAAVYRGIKK